MTQSTFIAFPRRSVRPLCLAAAAAAAALVASPKAARADTVDGVGVTFITSM